MVDNTFTRQSPMKDDTLREKDHNGEIQDSSVVSFDNLLFIDSVKILSTQIM